MCLESKNLIYTSLMGHYVHPMTADALLSQYLEGILVYGGHKVPINGILEKFCTNA